MLSNVHAEGSIKQNKTTPIDGAFCCGVTARCAAELGDINFKSAAYYYRRLREIICLATGNEIPFSGEIEVDESYPRLRGDKFWWHTKG